MQSNQPPAGPTEEGSKVKGFFSELIEGLKGMSSWLDDAWIKVNHLTETNYNLAFKLAQEGRIDDAIMRFRITLWIAPDHEPSLYNLACLYHHKGMNQKAMALFTRLIKANPKHTNALYMVATIDPSLLKPEMRPTTVPPIQLVEYFDNLAPFYDAEQTRKLYRLPAILHQLLRPGLDTNIAHQDMLDMGCGTGLVGGEFREEFNNIIGVDLSSNMLERAHRRVDRRGVRIYNQLIHQDIRHYLAQTDVPSFDVAVGMQLLPYIGDLRLLAAQLANVIRSGGIVALSFDPFTEKDGFGVMPATGYFGHSLSYVKETMQAAGFDMARSGEVEAYSGEHVQLCFFRKLAPKTDDSNPASE